MIFYTVYMDQRPVTDWIQELEIYQPEGEIYKEFSITFAGWAAVEHYQAGATWDVFSSYDPDDPRSEIEIRAGVVPPDREQLVLLEAGRIPEIRVHGYDQVWLALRRRPRDTIVVVPGSGFGEGDASAAAALEAYDGPVGRYQVWSYLPTVHRVLERLAREAGFRVDLRFPDRSISPYVIPPERGYFDELRELTEPWGLKRYYHRSTNTLLLLDPTAPYYGIGQVLELAAKNVSRMDALPLTTRRIRRVIVRLR